MNMYHIYLFTIKSLMLIVLDYKYYWGCLPKNLFANR
jgi:hypothetical protein